MAALQPLSGGRDNWALDFKSPPSWIGKGTRTTLAASGIGARTKRPAEVKPRVDDLLEVIQMTGFRRSYPSQLSAGMKHRTALARAADA